MKGRAAVFFAFAAAGIAGAFAGPETVLYSFKGDIAGKNPATGLVRGPDGDFYGATINGSSGLLGNGAIFKVTPTGTLTTLYSFPDVEAAYGAQLYGSNPDSLVLASNGNFYGTTANSGAQPLSAGTVFAMTPGGALTSLYSFTGNGDGGGPGALIQGTNGIFYGTTDTGGVNEDGVIFAFAGSGSPTTLHSFADGDYSTTVPPSVTEGADGNLYGVTQEGGTNGYGSVFKMTPGGAFSTIHSFTGQGDGGLPVAGLTLGPDGNLYGTTQAGASHQYGSVFKITPAGALTTIYSFTGVGIDGWEPDAALTLGIDGNFYGTALNGGTGNNGEVFKITPTGTLTVLYDFAGQPDAQNPHDALAQDPSGNLYGSTSTGGSAGYGAIYKIANSVAGSPTVFPKFTAQPGPASGKAGANASFTVAATSLMAFAYQWQMSSNGGSTWTIVPAASPYSGQATNRLTINGATGAMSGYEFRCVATNLAGSTDSEAARLTVSKLTQTINFPGPGNQSYGTAPFALSATATSGLPVSFSKVSGPATFQAGKLVLTGIGTVEVAANQAGNATYSAAPTVSRSFPVAKGAQTITFPAIPNKTFGAPPFTLSATASSGLTVTFAKVSGPATVTGKTVTLTGAGTVTIRAYASGDADYNAATPVDRSFTVAPKG
jgi:uncharacterized repeat protein (TIGR03803 family)